MCILLAEAVADPLTPGKTAEPENLIAQAIPTPIAPLAASSITVTARKTSSSLLGRLLLAMAYVQDPVLGKLVKKQKYIGPFVLAEVLGVYGLTLGDGIWAAHLGVTDPIPTTVKEVKRRIAIPSNITIIVGGVSLATLGIVLWWQTRYGKKIKARQALIQAHVENILQQLSQGAADDDVRVELVSLVGKDASEEFLQLWRSAHVAPLVPSSPQLQTP